MAEKIKKHWDLVLVGGIGLTLAIIGMLVMSGLLVLPNTASAVTTTQTVTVSATVQPWLTFTVSTSSVQLLPDLVDTAGATHIASSTAITMTVGSNADSYTMYIKDLNAGIKEGGGVLIPSVAVTSTLTEGSDNDNYGAQATTTLSEVTIQSLYNSWGTETVGRVTTTDDTLFIDTGTPATDRTADLKLKAECDSLQKAATYSDTVTLSAVSGT